ncbi:MAG: hypothetical protein IAI49_09500 [Candidatus Eremiobacteraeota bacterium]|nr:hypothetical protein [Candidatus Eremiobacteraeota bacterium]
MLTGGARDVLPRQQTLRALIDWSYDLLDARESALFRHLGMFVNGFTLEGAAAIGVGAGLDELDAFDVLSSLVDKSLVLAEPDGADVRYRLLESTRVYASEKLVGAGERSRCASLHLLYLLDRIARGRRLYDETGRRAELVDVLATELEDVRAALAGALSGDAVAGGRLLAEVGSGWANLGLDNEGIGWDESFSTALADSGELPLLARISTAISVLKGNTSRVPAAFEAATRAVAYARASEDRAALAEALWMYGYTASRLRNYDIFETALVEAEAMTGLAASVRLAMLQTRASVSLHRGDHATAAHAFEELRTAHRALGNRHSELTITQSLAEIEHLRGRTRDAIAIAKDVLPALRTQSDRGLLIMVLANLAAYSAAAGDLAEAFAAAREALQVLAGEPDIVYVAIALEHLALALALHGNFPVAATLAGYVDVALPRLGFDREHTERTTHDRLAALLRERLTPDELAHRVSQGAALAPETAVSLALDAIEAFFASRAEPIG